MRTPKGAASQPAEPGSGGQDGRVGPHGRAVPGEGHDPGAQIPYTGDLQAGDDLPGWAPCAGRGGSASEP
ncbi:hypothetical protein ACIP6X_29945 [Streptomyces coeruleorubidus]|uniref:hypothetical protein n=1 Tax=Streptomyces coeruleorubidus TaxID=116188 RepID=UPI00382F6A27